MTLQRIFSTWLREVLRWFRLKKLALELYNSRRFQKRCQRSHCFILAELEDEYQAELLGKMAKLKKPDQA